MKVTLLAQTNLTGWIDSISDTEFGNDSSWLAGEYSRADRLAHIAGRACYQSWNMPNPKTATDEGYIANILNQQHFSVLEHASATFYVEDVSRALTHELVRHRHLSFSQLSQRYVDYANTEPVIPPAANAEQERHIRDAYQWSLIQYNKAVERYIADGFTRKQAREAARALLPNCAPTSIVVTGNHRAWRDMLIKRYSVHADAEIRELAAELLRQLRAIAPATYQDFPEEPFK